MRRKLRRVGALALVIAMLLSMLAQGFAANEPQGGASTLSNVSPAAAGTSTAPERFDASADSTGKPRIYVDFLGDNAGHNSRGEDTNDSVATLPAMPESGDYSIVTGNGNWSRYTNDPIYNYDKDTTVFYVGVGIDRMNLLKALEGAAGADAGGVYSFEAGFYYNPKYVEPYVAGDDNGDTTDDYARTIADINLSAGMYSTGTHVNRTAGNTHWDGSTYRVVDAVTGVDVAQHFDGGIGDIDGDGLDDDWGELTQEVISDPTNKDIMDGVWSDGAGWKLTYVSIEMDAEALKAALDKGDGNTSTGARLEGAYDNNYNEDSNLGTEYLLIIPFVLKEYDDVNPEPKLCFRLVRNATHFTIGAMNGGNVNYAAWERVTTRNSDSNLKLQTTFTGDLNIFTGEKEKDKEYTHEALLRVFNGGSPQNTAKVMIKDDPSPNPVFIDADREIMSGLAGGTGMTVTVRALDQYKVSVNVYRTVPLDGVQNKTPIVTFNPIGTPTPGDERETTYTFIMPEYDVTIEVIFELDPNKPKNFDVVLMETNREGNDITTDDSPIDRPDVDKPVIVGNFTKVTAYRRVVDGNGDPVPDANGKYQYEPDYVYSTDPDTYYHTGDGNRYPSVTATADDATWDGTVSVETTLHPDYIAEITFRRADNAIISPTGRPNGSDLQQYTDVYGAYYVLTIEESGTYTFLMPASDVYLMITYRLADKYSASLELRHVTLDENGAETADIVNDLNRAQLSIVGYQDDGVTKERLYGVTYKDNKNNDGYSISSDVAILDPAYNIVPVPISASTNTGSTNGDSDPAPLSYPPFTDPTYVVSGQDDSNIKARAGREVFVAVETSSAHMIDRIEIIDPLNNDPTQPTYVAPILATRHADYSNVYTFEMPDYDSEVVVYYKLRTNPSVTIKYSGFTGGWLSTVSAVGPSIGSLYPVPNSITNDGESMFALSGGTVTVTIGNIDSDYTAMVLVTTSDGSSVPTSPAGINLTANASVTFPMPSLDTTVTIIYNPIQKDQYRAVINVVGTDGRPVTGANAVFYTNTTGGTNYNIMLATEGTHLPGLVFVPTGYYIQGVTANGASTSYPFTQSGNGWVNGRPGGVSVEINASMPAEDLDITVVIAQGPPPEDPTYAVTLFVEDPDNVFVDANGDGYNDDDNSATMVYIDADGDGYLDDRGKVVGYTPVPSDKLAYDTIYTTGGTTVTVYANKDPDYYIKSVRTAPASLGVGIVWDTPTTFHFTTPERSVSVTVEYAKIDGAAPEDIAAQLTVDKTENGSYADATMDNNTLNRIEFQYLGTTYTEPSSGNTIDLNRGNVFTTGVDKLTEVSAAVRIAAGWHVASVRLVYGGYTRYLPLNGLDTDNSGGTTAKPLTLPNFYMPTSDAELIIDYRRGAPVDGQRTLTLIVDDPYNVTQDANSAWLTVDKLDGTKVPLGPFGAQIDTMSGSTVAVKGETVTVEWETADGYALELLAVTTAGGVRIAPQYTYTPPVYSSDGKTLLIAAKTTATFTMPDDHTTVLVRFMHGSDRLFRADLVIYEYGDEYNSADNRASLADTVYTVANDVYVKGGLHAGETVEVFAKAVDGYYIDYITVTPYSSGVSATVTGAFGRQYTSFRMPASDVQVNVVFRKGWPTDLGGDDPAKFDIRLTVVDEGYNSGVADDKNNFAHLRGTNLTNDFYVVRGGETRVPVGELDDGKIGNVHLHSIAGSYVESVEIIDANGDPVRWWWSGTYSNTVAFYMPPSDIEVIVTYKQGTPTPHTATLHAVSRNSAAGTAELTIVSQDPDSALTLVPVTSTATTAHNGSPVSLTVDAANTSLSGSITGVQAGELLKVKATADINNDNVPDYIVSAIYAISEDTTLVLHPLQTGGASPITGGGEVSFAMPNANVDVYVVFDKIPDPYQEIANLEVSGPDSASGSAELMKWNGDNKNDLTDTVGLVSTGALKPANSDYILLGMTQTARVDITPNDGYVLDRISVVDHLGNQIEYEWIADTGYYIDRDGDGYAREDGSDGAVIEPTYAITYVQPKGGSWVKVEFAEREKDDEGNPKTYSAQVVVNNADNPANTAEISEDALNTWLKYIDNLDPGDKIDIKIVCAEGYRFDIDIVPLSHNIVPTLTEADNKSQETAFRMPADDVIVYVRFEQDTQSRFNATLSLVGSGGGSYADLSSDFATTPKRVAMGGSATVKALPTEEWVYVDLNVASGHYVTLIEVTTATGDPVLFTVDANGDISFPMAEEDVNIVVHLGATEPTHTVTLNVYATSDNVGNGTATLTERAAPTNTVSVSGSVYGASGALTSMVAAGRYVDLTNSIYTTQQDSRLYFIDSVYAEYASGPYTGQRIALDISGATYNELGELTGFTLANFVMQPYDIDVFVIYGMVDVTSPSNEYDVKLEVFGEVGAGSATLTGGTPTITVYAQPAGAGRTAAASAGTQMVMKVDVTTSYEIDYISVTPIGTNLGWLLVDGSYVFEMPPQDITIQIHLKKSTAADYIATLHYVEVSQNGSVVKQSSSRVSFYDQSGLYRYTDGTSSTDVNKPIPGSTDKVGVDQLLVPEAQRVTVGAYINLQDYYVLSAYVLRDDGKMVALTPGIDGTTYNNSLLTTDPEAEAVFVMPPANVDVYVVITDLPRPANDWTTVALVATDGLLDGTIKNDEHRIAEIYEESADDFIYEIDFKAGGAVNTLSPTDYYIGYVTSGGNATHKSYIVEVDGTNKRIFVNEGDMNISPYRFVEPAELTASGPSSATLSRRTANPYEYFYTMPGVDTATKMHYVESDLEGADLRVEIIDSENPSDNSVTNALKVNAPDKDELNLVSVTSAGAWHVIPSVMPTGEVTFTATPFDEDMIVVATIIANGVATPIELTKNADGSYSGKFNMPSGKGTLRVEFTYSSVTLELLDRSSAVTTTVAQMTVHGPLSLDEIILPVGASAGTAAASEVSDSGVSELAAGSVSEGADRSIISETPYGGTRQTVSGIPNYTKTSTQVELGAGDRLVSIIGEDGRGSASMLAQGLDASQNGIFYTYGESKVTVLVEDDSTAAVRYLAALNLIDATDDEAADGSLRNDNPGPHDSGQMWTTAYVNDKIHVKFTVGENRAAAVANSNGWPQAAKDALLAEMASNGITSPSLDNIPAGTYEFSFDATDIATFNGYKLNIRYYSLSEISLAVIDYTGVVGNKATLEYRYNSDDESIAAYTSSVSGWNGVVDSKFVTKYQSVNSDVELELVTEVVENSSTVARVFAESENGMTRITSWGTDNTFNVPAGKSTIWVIYGDSNGNLPPDPVDPKPNAKPHTAKLVVDSESTSGWDTAGNSIDSLLNVSRPSALGGDLWKFAYAGDEIRGTFTVVPGWKVVITVKDGDNNPIPFIRQTSVNSEFVIIQQPDSDSVITVKFVEVTDNESTPSSKLHFSIIGHDGQAGNNATLTINDLSITKTLSGDLASNDPEIYDFPETVTVPFGAQLELEATWATGYSIKKITVELRDSTTKAITASYVVSGNEYNNIITAWMTMPDQEAYVCVYYGNDYTATLNYNFLGSGTGTAEMYDAANRAATVVTGHLDEIRNLAGGETISTEPTAGTNSRLVGVVYETKYGGARPTTKQPSGEIYNVTMPEEDIDVHVVFEKDGENSFIAMVTLEGESDVADNDAIIRNISRNSVGTDHWRTAQGGDSITITVSLAEGYQAEVTAVSPTGLYLTRMVFHTSNLVSNFTMPAGTDAIVTIRFIKGYTASLVLKDLSDEPGNSASMVDDATLTKVTAASHGDGYVEYNKYNNLAVSATATATVLATSAPGDDSEANKIREIGIGTKIDGDVNVVDGAKLYQLLYSTDFGGTFSLDTARLKSNPNTALPIPGSGGLKWLLEAINSIDPVEDVEITAVVVDENDNPLIAKVQLEGDSDINGNTASILNTEPGKTWLKGGIWTTAEQTNTIEVTVDLAPGYNAMVIVINDKIYADTLSVLDNDGTISDADIEAAREAAKMPFTHDSTGGLTSVNITESSATKKITLMMPWNDDDTADTVDDVSDVTVIVEFGGEPGPRPYDPYNDEYAFGGKVYLEKGWIYGTNHGDYATITVPTLLVSEGVLDDVYRPESSTGAGDGTLNTFRISVWVDNHDGTGSFVELQMGSEINIYPVSTPVEDTGYPYNSGNYYPGVGDYTAKPTNASDSGYNYTGAKFNIELLELAAGTVPSEAYKALRQILNIDGSYSSSNAPQGTLLRISAVDADGRVSDPTQLVIPAYYSLEGTIVSYAPQHTATFTLHEKAGTGNTEPVDADGYLIEEHTVSELTQNYGSGEWMQDFAIKSSDLAGRDASAVITDFAAMIEGADKYSGIATYKMVIEKPAVLTYERTNITLQIIEGVTVKEYVDPNASTDRNWIFARKATVEDTATASEDASLLLAGQESSTNDSYGVDPDASATNVASESATASTFSRTEAPAPSAGGTYYTIYGVTADTRPIYGVTNDTTPVETASYNRVEEAAPSAQVEVLVRDLIVLFTGDVDGNNRIVQADYNLVNYYATRRDSWSTAAQGETGWEKSTHNPESEAYRADLNGDRRINSRDIAVYTDNNYNKYVSDYGSPSGLVRGLLAAYDETVAVYIANLSLDADMGAFTPAIPNLSETITPSTGAANSGLSSDEGTSDENTPTDSGEPEIEDVQTEGDVPTDDTPTVDEAGEDGDVQLSVEGDSGDDSGEVEVSAVPGSFTESTAPSPAILPSAPEDDEEQS